MIPTPSLRVRPAGPRRATPPLAAGRPAAGPTPTRSEAGFGATEVGSFAATAARRFAQTAEGGFGLIAEDGFGLIEVLISSLLVAVIAIGTFTGFDVTNKLTSNQRARAQADQIAQQWEERLRGVQTADIAALQKSFCVNDQGTQVAAALPCPVAVAGYTGTIFQVETSGKFVSDSSGVGSCAKESSSADYVQTTTQVTWPSIGTGAPVSETSIVTPPISSQLLVQDYNGPNPVPGVSVAAIGPAPATTSKTLATGANGCALFTTLEPGEYTVSVNQIGYVEKNGNQEYSVKRNLVAGDSTSVSLEYDRAGEIKASYVSTATGVAVKGDSFLAVNGLVEVTRGFGKPSSPPTAEVASPITVFPFHYQTTPSEISSYNVYAGGCESNNPEPYGDRGAIKAINMAPAGRVPVKLEMPPISAFVTKEGTALNATGSISEITSDVSPTAGPFCGALAKRTITATTAGALPYTALPFGKYELCLEANLGTTPAKWWRLKKTFENKTVAGSALGTLNLASGESFGTTKPAC
jgi:Tfp pilus assembly protein PilV